MFCPADGQEQETVLTGGSSDGAISAGRILQKAGKLNLLNFTEYYAGKIISSA
jgi:hypothetical protein